MKKIYTLLVLLSTTSMLAQDLVMTVSAPPGTVEFRMTGPWWSWNPAGGPVATDNGNDTFTFTLSPAPTGNMEYLFVADGVQEVLWDNAANAECTNRIDNGNLITDYFSYGNRIWKVSDGNIWNEEYDSCAEATLSINDIELIDISVYPNPSNNVWNIEGKEIINEIQVHDVLGKKVMSLTPRANDVSIDASTLPKGLYFAKLTTEVGSDSIKLIKN